MALTDAAQLACHENLRRLADLYRSCTQEEQREIFKTELPAESREVWPPQNFTTAPQRSATVYRSTSIVAAAAARSSTRAASPSSSLSRSSSTFSAANGGAPGVVIKPDYFTGSQAHLWQKFFSHRYYLRNEPTAPLLQCPFCCSEDRSAASTGQATQQRKWRAPPALMRHMSWAHGEAGGSSLDLQLHNDEALGELLARCRLRPSSAGAPPARLLIFVDMANYEIGATDVFLDLLSDPAAVELFSSVPIAFCAMHELFVPLTSLILHGMYQLARLNPFSSLHLFYAISRLESGDMMSTSTLTNLHLAANGIHDLPPAVLVTMDGQQRCSTTELFGDSQSRLAPVGCVHAVPTAGVASLLSEVRSALLSSTFSV